MKKDKLNITVVGLGYVGLSMAVLLAQKNNVIALDINKDRVDSINNKVVGVPIIEAAGGRH